MPKNDVRPDSEPLQDWQAVAAALNARMTARRIGQQELADLAGVSVATLRVLQRGANGRRVHDATLAAVCRALDWPSDYLLRVYLGEPLPDVAPSPAETLVDLQAEILAVLRRIEYHVEKLTRRLTPA